MSIGSGAHTGRGDLSRRVAHRRAELGLSRQEVAERAGMATGYVAYLEEHPPQLTRWALTRLADALRTTPGALLGADADQPPGAERTAAPAPVLYTLGADECMRLVGPGGIGRICFSTEGSCGPAVLPVTYTVVDGNIVFRTSPDGVIAEHAEGYVSFEVDQLDGVMSEGWSVLIRGRARQVRDPGERAALQRCTAVRPWAGGVRDAFITIVPTRVSGRRIWSHGPGAPPPAPAPRRPETEDAVPDEDWG
ncbi:helix-turn-helix domain-containing protein [Marinactinospora rubrisoli]|uniref:Helix-turn-helix domain-containing protein n=1 Tax=Marinactinospora rubrisoli TaxID=2715399 RepID=A0ABW2KNW2_9ACTN